MKLKNLHLVTGATQKLSAVHLLRSAFLLVGMLICLSYQGFSQTTAASYNFARTSGAFSSISGTGTLVGGGMISDDGNTAGIPLGFTFTFCGASYTTVSGCANGVLSLSNNGATYVVNPANISGAGFLMPIWADDYGAPFGGITPVAYYQTTGVAGSRVFTIEWASWNVCCWAPQNMNFQVKLYEGTNTIQFCYGSADFVTNGIIGIANSTTDFQTLPSSGSTVCNSSFNFCDMPANGTILTWTTPCTPGTTLPAIIAMTGGGGYCTGGSGVNVGLAGSAVGINYQLYLGGVPVGTPVAGVGSAFSFGLQTAAGVYTATATNPTTGCTSPMSGSKTVYIYSLPNVYTVTGGGSLCSGGPGVSIGLSGSDVGAHYQLYMSGYPIVGTIVTGTGGPITFGFRTTPGTYTVVATSAGFTGCTNNMTGSATITVNPLPSVFLMTGGGSYCAGGTGMPVGLSNSELGVDYQLYSGTTPIGAPVSGTGGAISFGTITAAGTYTAKATNTTTGCLNNMYGSASVYILPMPTVYSVTGGGGYCAGGAGANVGLSGSTFGVNYQLYLGGVPTGSPVAGTGSAITFGPQAATGVYTVVATNASSGCVSNMTGSVTVSINSLPNVYTVTGGGGYCAGGTMIGIGLSNSDPGVNYQLYRGGTTAVGGPMGGTGGAISFGLFSIAGTYTVLAYNPATGCSSSMSGSATITVLARPAIIAVTGGGGYCTGSAGVNVGLAASATGISYQLYLAGVPVGSPVIGTGAALSFGLQTTPGTYTVVATDLTTLCTTNMSGSATVYVYSLPSVFTLTGGGSYCAGGSGVPIYLTGSSTGVNYQLYLGGLPVVGTIVAGTGSAISFGPQTGAGTYTAVATASGFTGCTIAMSGSVTISIDPLPTVYSVTGGGGYCSGMSGVHIGLTNSDLGVNYQLYKGLFVVGTPIAGTGAALDFGLYTTNGTYTVKAINATTGCVNWMSGNAIVTVNSLPYPLTVTGGGGYCVGGTGVLIGLAGSVFGTDYQLYLGATPMGSPVSGTGAGISFGLQTTAGVYTVIATNTTTGCTNTMTGSATVTINTPPTAYTVAGGGGYCAGGTGVHVYLAGSSTSVMYQLYRGTTPVGAPVAGTGSALDFGLQTIAGSYGVVATAVGSLCSASMSGSVTVTVSPLPTADTVLGGGAYCTGGTGMHVYLSNSTSGINYQLYLGSTAVGSPVAGTGSALDFGLETAAGTYTVIATDATTGCVNNMTGSATVSIITLPTVYSVTGGGSFCAGGIGVPVYLSGSQAGVNYQLYNGATPVGTAWAGTGAAISFGLQTTGGTYTVVATTGSGGCVNNMAGSAVVTVNTAPTVYSVTGGGGFCSGGVGVAVGVSGSDAGVYYQLYRASVAVGSPVLGTGSAISFGLQTINGTYTVMTTGSGCNSTMSGSAVVTVGTLPAVVSVTGGGGYCSGGAGVAVGLAASAVGVNYQLYLGGTPVGSPVAGTGMALTFGLQTAAGVYTVIGAYGGGTGCANNMAGSATVYIYSNPTVYNVVGGGGYCAGGSGVHVYLSGSNSGISYRLYNTGTPVGSAVSGTGTAMDFGLYTAAGIYTVVATASGTGCTSAMAGADTITINPLPTISGSIYTVAPSSTITLVGTPGGGTFTSSNTAIATVGSSTGVVSGVSLGTIVISYTLSTGCAAGHTVAVTPTGHRDAPGENTITTTSTRSDVFVMPNPNKGIFTVKGNLSTTADAQVYLQVTDMVGRVIYTNVINVHGGVIDQEIDLGNITNGMYLLNVHSDEANDVFHIVVEK